jgi:ATP-dependent DNA ligase
MTKTLYKKDSTGNIRYISFTNNIENLKIEHGVLNTNNPIVEYVECKPKNIGKKNETTLVEQIEKELNSRFKKKLDQGYKYSIEEAKENVGTDASGFIKPMLAHEFKKKQHTVKFPVYAQPKFDGIRGTIELTENSCIARSRSGKKIKLWPQIIRELNYIYKNSPEEKIILDGEFYSDLLPFESINGVTKNYENYTSFIYSQVKFIIFDVIDFTLPFEKRILVLNELEKIKNLASLKSVDITKTVIVYDDNSITNYLNECLQNGYEGVMIRSKKGLYESKRSKELLKLKLMQDAEFRIIDVEEAAHKTGVFVCETKEKATFKVAFKGTHAEREKILLNKTDYIGKLLTVQFQEFTAYGVPRFTVGLRIRENE